MPNPSPLIRLFRVTPGCFVSSALRVHLRMVVVVLVAALSSALVCLQKMEYFWKRITADPQRAKEYGNPVSVITSSVHTTFDNFGLNDGALG